MRLFITFSRKKNEAFKLFSFFFPLRQLRYTRELIIPQLLFSPILISENNEITFHFEVLYLVTLIKFDIFLDVLTLFSFTCQIQIICHIIRAKLYNFTIHGGLISPCWQTRVVEGFNFSFILNFLRKDPLYWKRLINEVLKSRPPKEKGFHRSYTYRVRQYKLPIFIVV